ncbi:hypothetical protein [Sphingobacterium yanglingense]|uniref:hypothetical protein n=1 Tax=Sphingobacterium yanglingense TaxID=1437280 RepID=UPI001061F59D|nr:hypothetical protein [Sphingobacterium yanglingense]
MHIFIKTVALLFAITHLWVSGSLLRHKHDDCHGQDNDSCHHTDESTGHDDCAICYYIYLPNSLAATDALQIEYIPTISFSTYNVSLDTTIVTLKPRLYTNKDPPVYI